ncbi:hypothetical protein Micbo1qcDRAFT_140223 [Microdochium bolleyi]|uniref:Uncharacterized protein n=1 Tax=Microdochium bolleyi TaxID=196109 RepID=A0A136INU4_9PEZI|nr:hypothetical protein Micbo1qcDRAFT_140223 [Microdochium bolleyi]
MHETLLDLQDELQLDSDLVQDSMSAQQATYRSHLKMPLKKDERRLQAFKVKFLQGEANRKRLLKQLKDSNEKLRRLLDSIDKDIRLTSSIETTRSITAADAALCGFWKTATAFFRALIATYNCSCLKPQPASLLLQHRASCKTDIKFQMIFSIDESQPLETSCAACTTTIEESVNAAASAKSHVLIEKRTFSQTATHGQDTSPALNCRLAPNPKMSTAKAQRKPQVRFTPTVFTPTVSLTVPLDDTSRTQPRASRHLCESLTTVDATYRDYIQLPDEDRRYYIASVTHHSQMPKAVTLDQVLSGHLALVPTRRETLALAFVLTSSLVQLQESPWLAASARCFDKTSIVFLVDPTDTRTLLFGQPYIRKDFNVSASTCTSGSDNNKLHQNTALPCHSSRPAEVTANLARLGITLLELCFRSPLERQPFRIALGVGVTEQQHDALDLAAATMWLEAVSDEAGPIYAAVVKWCLSDNRVCPAARWREDMVRHVVKPLQTCLEGFDGVNKAAS